ncbi:MAG: hypothetical protein Q4C10_12505 [Clostridia bacterium]|nr:hypothetical protein [Clostridia bacterium]
MPRLWAKIIRKHRIEKQATAECRWEEAEDALTELCREFDIPRPLWLNKHEREFGEFRRTQFLPEHFMEDVNFQRLEIEFLEDDAKSRRSQDPRNQFDGF